MQDVFYFYSMEIVIIQTDLIWENPKENRTQFNRKIDAISQPVDLIVLPVNLIFSIPFLFSYIKTNSGNVIRITFGFRNGHKICSIGFECYGFALMFISCVRRFLGSVFLGEFHRLNFNTYSNGIL